jgi:hypothetical protein
MNIKKVWGILAFLCIYLFAWTASVNAAAKCHAIQLDPTDSQSFLPDPYCTPGAINPDVTQENLATTICSKGFTKKIRPSTSFTNKLKKQQILEYGYLDTNLKNYEEDHLISLELGGSPDDPKNLWPEPHPSINKKDTIENYLREEICAHRMTLAQAQYKISRNWYELYQSLHPASVWEVLKNSFAQFITALRDFLK